MRGRALLLGSLLVVSGGWQEQTARAHAGYLTTYSHHIDKGETEVSLFLDVTRPSAHKRRKDNQRNYISQMLELKYCPLSQLALELMLEGFQEPGTGTAKYTGARFEGRYRLFKDDVPLNPVLYAEYEDLDPETRFKMEVSGWVDPPYTKASGSEPAREAILESRLVLSQDFGPINTAFNWINESDLHGGETAFGYSMGLFYRRGKGHAGHGAHRPWVRWASAALELFGALGDTIEFGLRPSRQEHYAQPSVMFHFGEHAMVSLGAAVGLTSSSDMMVRTLWGWKF